MKAGYLGRRVYMVLLRLHPCGFRRGYATEMLQAFDDGAAEFGVGWLLGDAVVSLLRQRVLRAEDEGLLAASSEVFGLMAGVYPMLRPPHLTMGKLSTAFLMSSLLYMLIRPF